MRHSSFALICLMIAPIAMAAPSDLEVSAPLSSPNGLRMNDIQTIGTHNSYKIAIPPKELAMIALKSADTARELDYSHVSLTAQLDLGMRQLEIDIVYDPIGGRYAHPKLPQLSGLPYDASEMDQPGFKVLHIPDVDVRSHCATFIKCLSQIKDWSDAHPNHVPILIMMNAKDGKAAIDGGVAPLDYDAAAFEALDAEIISVFAPDRLITPDMVRGREKTLREGVLNGGWPDLDAARGKVFFALDEGPEKVTIYMRGHSSLEGLPIFVNSINESADHAAYFTLNDPTEDFARIQNDVKAGFIVRTRADAGTVEARNIDVSRLKKALDSGAQYISTDYPTPRIEFGAYMVTLPKGEIARPNPVLSDK